MITFAIIGSGLSGMALFCQLVEKVIALPSDKYKIILFEKHSNQFSTGEPYSTENPTIWTLNNPANKFKLMSNGINLADWMAANKDQWKSLFPEINEEYPPRALVGLYLKAEYARYKNKALLNDIEIKEYLEEVVDVNCDSDKWEIITPSHQYTATQLYLCLGHAPLDQFTHLKTNPNFFPMGTSIEKFKSIPKKSDVYIIGGQATFIDIALWLAYVNQHVGRIVTITRQPSTISSKGNNDDCKAPPIEELKDTLQSKYQPDSLASADAISLFWNTYKKSAINPVDFTSRPRTSTVLRYQLAKYENSSSVANLDMGNVDEFRSFIFKFYFSGCFAEVWEKLKDDEKENFNKQFFTFFFSYLTGTTPLNARLLLELYERKQICEKHGIKLISHDIKKNRFILHFENGETEEAEYIIDSSGLGYNISKQSTDFPLLSNLVKKGILVPGKFGGILLNEFGQAIDKNNRLQPNLVCIGPTAAYCHPIPTPYGSFIAVETVEKALRMIDVTPAKQFPELKTPYRKRSA